jgi:cytochrome c553
MRYLPLVIFVAMLFPPRTFADEPASAGLEFFERKIRPLLVENCFKCHTGPKLKANLALDNRAAVLKGGDTGPALVPGEPGKSLIMKAIGYQDPELRMPPRGKLSDQQIADVAAWITMGARWPADATAKSLVKKDFNLGERSGHWSLRPFAWLLRPHEIRPPIIVKNRAWIESWLDTLILEKLEQNALPPAPRADRRTLIRRVTFDLIGLPPTLQEIDAFVNDQSPAAFAKVVDRLLASPHYGERWARHWLDLVRYAETHGHEFDFDIPDAWRYRDYVIRAFNADVPYNQFVTEHLAGDLLQNPRRNPETGTNESILGTGFWYLGEAKHSPVDTRGDQADHIDNQIDVFGKTFLGMTLACARCHDHKFDAISTKDYYALAGYLQSSRPQRAFLDDPAPRLLKLGRLQALQEKARNLAIQETVAYLRSQPTLSTAPLWTLLGDKVAPEQFQAAQQKALERLNTQQAEADQARSRAVIFADAKGGFRNWSATGEAFSVMASGSTVSLDFTSPLTVAALHPGYAARSDTLLPALQGAVRSPTFVIGKKKIHIRAAGTDVRVRLILNGLQLIQEPIYGQLAYTVNTKAKAGSTSSGKRPDFASPLERNESFRWHSMDVSMWLGQRAYIEILDDGNGYAAFDQIIFSDEGPPPEAPNRLYVALLNDPANASLEQLTKTYARLAGTILDQWEAGKLDEQPDALDRIHVLNAILATTKTEGARRADNNQKLWQELDREYAQIGLPLPAPVRGLAMTDGSPVDEHVFIRGNHKNLGEVVPRRFLEVFGGTDSPAPAKASGRLELAQQMIDPSRTPMLARVIVNRLWQHHFGQGIVRSSDDFGVQGQAPTHPDLLDALAEHFVKNGWSIKKMHRLMLLSSAYQMSSRASAEADEADPDNRWLHKMPVRRLEAEEIRDAMLAVSGRLNKTQFGPSIQPHLTPFMAGRGRPNVSGPLDGDGRRSIYLGVRRNFLNPMFLAFDYPTPFTSMGKRNVSNVPAQALTMMNNPLVLQQAELWAKRTLADKNVTPHDRIAGMYLAALGRLPSPAELAEADTFLEEQARVYGRPDDLRAWTDLAHVLFNVKEFIFVN